MTDGFTFALIALAAICFIGYCSMSPYDRRERNKILWRLLDKFGDAFANGVGFVGGIVFTMFIIALVVGSFHK